MNASQLERFMAKVESGESGCWLWTGSKDQNGYGRFMLDGRRRPGKRPFAAHRVAFEHFVGAIPEGLDIDHLCRTPSCVNPSHLEPVTTRENCRRGIKGVLTTHCPHGHAYTPENTYLTPVGHRQCRACRIGRRTRTRRYRYERGACIGRRYGHDVFVWSVIDTTSGAVVSAHTQRRPAQAECSRLNTLDREQRLAALVAA